MIATVINAAAVFLGSILGLVFKNRIKTRYTDAVTKGVALFVIVIGLMNAMKTENILCVVICVIAGIVAGEMLKIENGLEYFGETVKKKLFRGREAGRFTEGFMGATLLFCVGAMTITGSMDAGIRGDYTILLSKSAMDGVMALTLAATMGVGVVFSGFSVLICQGLLTVLAVWAGPVLPGPAVTEMGAVGGLIIAGIGFNMLGITTGNKKLNIGNMLPALFLPILYIPCEIFIRGL
ncbi:MAG: DUF554 domain-containing protein [Oscillospiraceae bacterium]|nr:DUF554 domain-containing protein [Oscillospiraceae bacterium]